MVTGSVSIECLVVHGQMAQTGQIQSLSIQEEDWRALSNQTWGDMLCRQDLGVLTMGKTF